MKHNWIVFLAHFCIFSGATGIRCYICSGKDSYCKEKSQTVHDCSIRYRMDTCFKMIPTNYTGELTVTKLCHVKYECYREQKKCEESGKCRVFCCFTDFCNGSTRMASLKLRWMVLLVAFLAVIMNFQTWR